MHHSYIPYIFLLAGILWVSPAGVLAQSKSDEKKADKSFKANDFRSAYLHYKISIEQGGKDISLYYKFAESARQVNDFVLAEKYYTKILENQNSDKFSLTRFWLAHIKKSLGKYEEAVELFKLFTMMGYDDYYTHWAANEIQVCSWAMGQPNEQPGVQIDLLDEKINSYYSELAAFEMGNHLYYSTFKYALKQDKRMPKRHQLKMMSSKNLERGRPVPNEFTESGLHVGHTAFSLDWQRMYFTVCGYVGNEKLQCKIYYRDQDKNGDWLKESQPVKSVNLEGYTATHPCIALDPLTQKEMLYFSSDRPDGTGKMDIWFAEVHQKGFSKPKNLWQINTPEDEISPSFHNQTNTLSFSSNGYKGFGGMDIFTTQVLPDGNWDMVTNMGRPFNSGYDDLFFSKNTPGNRAYFSSNRPGSRHHRSMNEGCCHDIYRIYYKGMVDK